MNPASSAGSRKTDDRLRTDEGRESSTLRHLYPVEKFVDDKNRPRNPAPTAWQVRIFRLDLGVPKAMFLSWLTLVWTPIGGTTCESALSSQNLRFAHNPKGCSPHPSG